MAANVANPYNIGTQTSDCQDTRYWRYGHNGRNRFWNCNSTQFGGGPADADAGDAPMDGFYTSRNE